MTQVPQLKEQAILGHIKWLEQGLASATLLQLQPELPSGWPKVIAVIQQDLSKLRGQLDGINSSPR